MSRIVFVLYYSSIVLLIVSYNTQEIIHSRIAVILFLLSCWLHAQLWIEKINSIHESPNSIAHAFEILKQRRMESDFCFRFLPNVFIFTFTGVREYLFNKVTVKTIKSALTTYLKKNTWDLTVLPLISAYLIWIFGIHSLHLDRLYSINPYVHEIGIYATIYTFVMLSNVLLTVFFINASLRSSK